MSAPRHIHDAAALDSGGAISLTAGQAHHITVEYFEAGGLAVMQLVMKLARQVPSTSAFVPVPIAVLKN